MPNRQIFFLYRPNTSQGIKKRDKKTKETEQSDTGEETGDDISMPEYEEMAEEPKEELAKVNKVSRIIKLDSPERVETITLLSHKPEGRPKDELVTKSKKIKIMIFGIGGHLFKMKF